MSPDLIIARILRSLHIPVPQWLRYPYSPLSRFRSPAGWELWEVVLDVAAAAIARRGREWTS